MRPDAPSWRWITEKVGPTKKIIQFTPGIGPAFHYPRRAPPRRDPARTICLSSKAASHMPSPLELPSPSPVQESDNASIDDESSLSPEDEDDTENEEEHEMDSSLRPTSFCLNGKRWRRAMRLKCIW